MKIVFMGTPTFSVPILEAINKEYEVVLVVTKPDKLVGRKQILTSPPVKQKAIELGLDVYQPNKIRNEYQAILDKNPDMIITAAYGQIIPEEILKFPKYGCINVHGSLLPKRRGGAPIQRAIMEGDSETGITIMYMSKKMDAGDILLQKSIKIEDSDTSTTLFEKMSILGRDLLIDAIPKIVSGNITPIKQNEELVTFSYNLTKEEELIDFNNSASVIYNQIRALLDEPGAYFYFDGFKSENDRIKVLKAEIGDATFNIKPGSIVLVTKNYFSIACGNNTSINIYMIQQVGKKAISSKDFINGGFRKYWKG